jgi:hypothetical protein
MARCLYSNTGKNVRWKGKHQNLGEIWNGANPWGFFSQPQYPCTLSQDNLLLSPRATSQRLCGHGSKALHILNISNRSRWSAPFSSQFTFGELDPGTHWIGVGVAPIASVDMFITQIKVQSSASNNHCYMCPIHVLPFTFRTLSIKNIYINLTAVPQPTYSQGCPSTASLSSLTFARLV